VHSSVDTQHAKQGVGARLERVCWRVSAFLTSFGRKDAWRGPTCTCREFKDFGRCRHLDVFKGRRASSRRHKGGSGRSQKRRSTFQFLRKRSMASSTGQDGPSDKKKGDFQTSSSKLAIAHASVGDFVGEIMIPPKIKMYKPVLTLLDDLERGSHGQHIFRGVSDKHGVVLVKTLRCEAPTCLPDHNEALNTELEILKAMKKSAGVLSFLGYQEVFVEEDILQRNLAFEFGADTLGEHVFHRATGHSRLSFVEVRKYSMDLAKALKHLHKRGIMHRDLTSENVFMVRTPYPSSEEWVGTMRRHFRLSRKRGKNFVAVNGEDNGDDSGSEGDDEELTNSDDSSAGVARTEKKKKSSRLKSSISGFLGRTQPSDQQHHLIASPWQRAEASRNEIDHTATSRGPIYAAKVANFESATLFTKEELPLRTETRMTSPQYRSPEVFKAQPHDHKVDIWSLGCLIYEMLAKEKPFYKHYTLSQIEELVCNKRFPPKGHFAPSDFRSLEVIMHNCLDHDPSKRPSASAVFSNLESTFIDL